MIAITYRLRLLQPLLATAIQGDPNSSVSFDYLPGSMVRGALVARYLRAHQLHPDQALEHEVCADLFFSGQVRFLNAYPLSADRRRTLPTPRTLLRSKGDTLVNIDHAGKDERRSIEIYNAGHTQFTTDLRRKRELAKQEPLKPIGKPFCTLGTTTRFYAPDHSIAVHIQREPVKGRALREEGEVFQYDALAAEQCFGGIILTETLDTATEIQSLLQTDSHLWLGRSRSANYGRVICEGITIHQHEPDEPWREYSVDGDEYVDLLAGQVHSITLLSDLVLCGNDGAPPLQLDGKLLGQLLDVTDPATGQLAALSITAEHTFTSIELSGGFNRAWQMPLNQRYVLAAGSVISFVSPVALPAQRIRDLEEQGIGERRVDGYGRIAFNLFTQLSADAYAQDVYAEAGAAAEPAPIQQASLAERMARRLHQLELERKIDAYINNHLQRAYQDMPPNSQLGRVLVLVRQALPTGDVATVLRRFGQFKAASIDQFARARLDNRSLDTWIIELLEQPERVWGKLEFTQSLQVAGYTPTRNAQLTALQLIAAVLTATARLRRQAEEAANATA